jgi:hypothetical protein
VRWRKPALAGIAERLQQLGLRRCQVCNAEESLRVDRRPAMLDIGGFHHEGDDPRHDPEANVLFMVRVTCGLCGHTLLFDSEQFHHGNEPILFQGPEALEDELEADGG